VTSLHNWLFLYRHRRACRHARELARYSAEKRKRMVREVAQQMRRELGLKPDKRLV
jgi:DNA-directed RNA polymerase subunit F